MIHAGWEETDKFSKGMLCEAQFANIRSNNYSKVAYCRRKKAGEKQGKFSPASSQNERSKLQGGIGGREMS